MNTVKTLLKTLKQLADPSALAAQEYYGLNIRNRYGLRIPQMRQVAKEIGMNHALALQLWETGIHEARHVAIFIADPEKITGKLMEKWLKDFNSWDIVDNCCGTLFDKSPLAYKKAMEWTKRKKEFEKRAGFVMMAVLAVHDKKAKDNQFVQFFPYLLAESHDGRNFVKKAINWAIRQIGKRNTTLCIKSIALAKQIHKKGDTASKWIASDALRELEKYQAEGRIRKAGLPTNQFR